jgi:hypothetical protein
MVSGNEARPFPENPSDIVIHITEERIGIEIGIGEEDMEAGGGWSTPPPNDRRALRA